MKIARKLTTQDWKDLKEELKPTEDKLWSLAAHFFEERIKTRYLTPIHAIQNLNLNEGEGFAMVNLQCSLIETFECFINGWIFYLEGRNLVWKDKEGKVASYKNNSVKSKQIFISFFSRFNNEFKIDGEDFYSNVRCALLHETQTKGNWVIRVTEKDTKKCDKEDIDKYIIYRNNFQDQLKELLDEYQDCLIKNEDFREIKAKDLRENFIAKMDHICNQS
jgi:hypothetical protein|tara:strand:+ start:1861 stop:2520 length:660 start_codon:yes stop_codon:yes gene_type:complete